MDRDDLDERVRRAAQAEPATIERVVRAALAAEEGGPPAWDETTTPLSVRLWPRAFGVLAAGLMGAVALSVWWCVRPPAGVNDGVFQAEAVVDPAPAGVYRSQAEVFEPSSRAVRMTTDGGAAWILSTVPSDDWLPPGTSVVIGGREQ
jgi:hypothetical protein